MGDYDLAIIGGGINGCGIARDAAGRGLSVLLIEQGDLGGATSSASTKLIHGGLRYLEQFRFRLVRESLRERERLLALAPHLVRPARFVMPHVRGTRSAWKLRAGFALYDLIGGRTSLPKTRTLDLADDPAGAPLRAGFGLAFEYSDCIADDARLVIANAVGAREKGAVIRPRTRCVAARREDGLWHLILQSAGGRESVTARVLVNAAGPWAGRVLETVVRQPARTRVRLVKGSHIVVPRLHAHDRAYILPAHDGRFVFTVPFAGDFTLVGTTEVEVSPHSTDVAASSEEILYLCNVASGFFRTPLAPSSVVWTFAGVRALIDDGARKSTDVSRDYQLEFDGKSGDPLLVSVFGGKLTTYRRLAEKLVDRVGDRFALQARWTETNPLPGGDLGADGLDGLIRELRERYPFLEDPHARRLARAYGTRARNLLGSAQRSGDLGPRIVGDLQAAELDWLRREEWATTAEDVLWRRTKLGLVASDAETEALSAALGSGGVKEKLAG
jgi:glycerol-3-phosphate dehydrogenase